MTNAVPLLTPLSHLPLRVRSAKVLSDDALYELCLLNRDLRIERTKEGELVIMPPTGGKTGARNFRLIGQLYAWVEKNGGVGFDSSTGFILPNSAERSPDLAWVKTERWEALTEEQREKFIPLAPDFVLELRSPSDDIDELKAKMEEYRGCGVLLGWLLDPSSRRAYVYRPGVAPEELDAPARLDASPLLQGFALDLTKIWDT